MSTDLGWRLIDREEVELSGTPERRRVIPLVLLEGPGGARTAVVLDGDAFTLWSRRPSGAYGSTVRVSTAAVVLGRLVEHFRVRVVDGVALARCLSCEAEEVRLQDLDPEDGRCPACRAAPAEVA